jgi:uncharacterized membrane protein YccC
MAALFLLLAIVGASVVADLVMENTGTGTITVLNHPITGYSDGLLLAMAAAIGFAVGLLVVGSVSLRRTRRARRKQARTAERELSGQLLELESENSRLREDLARRDLAARRTPSPLANRQVEPVYEEARRVAGLRSGSDWSFPSTHG